MYGFIDRVEVDFVVNGRARGEFAESLSQVDYDSGLLRPMIMPDGQKYCWVKTGKEKVENGQIVRNQRGDPIPEREPIPLSRLSNAGLVPPVFNATALPYQAWQRIDDAVISATRDRPNAWNDLEAANSYSGFDGMGVTGLIKDTITDPGDAKVSMDNLQPDLNDSVLFNPDILPLPIIHAGFSIGPRMLAMSKNTKMPLDTGNAQACGRRVVDTLEKMTIGETDFTGLVIGNDTTFTNNGIYGFKTQPDRITKIDCTDVSTITEGTTQAALKDDVLEMITLAYAQKFFGPFVLYYNSTYDTIMQSDYWVMSTQGGAAPTKTVRQRLMEIEGISKIQRLDFAGTTSCLMLVQMNSDTVRAVNGMDWTPIQYEVPGGGGIVYRVMGIKVPDLRSQFIGTSTTVTDRKCGIVHGTTS